MSNYTYISSKMSGLPEYNFPAFAAMKERLEAKGYKVWSPAEHNPKRCRSWTDFIRDDISVLDKKCIGIFMFGAWYRSHGALVELLSAHRLGLKIEIQQWVFSPLQWVLNRRNT